MSKKVEAQGAWLVIEPIEEKDKPNGGIIIPETAKEGMKGDADYAKIISVGDEVPGNLKTGDTALVLLGSCLTLPGWEDKNYLCCRGDRVVCKIS